VDNETAGTLATNSDWPQNKMPTDQAAAYLYKVHGLPVQPKTMRNWRAAGRGPRCRYFGTKPIYDRSELDDYAENALSDESPITRARRSAKIDRERTAQTPEAAA
jgi:hypothetical protein